MYPALDFVLINITCYRSGIANGSVGVGKSEGISQPTGLGPRSSIPRTDLDNSSHLNDRRDRPVPPDKERVNLKAVNKYANFFSTYFIFHLLRIFLWSSCGLGHPYFWLLKYYSFWGLTVCLPFVCLFFLLYNVQDECS